MEIAEACKLLDIQHIIEDKAYPRDWLMRGRLRLNETSSMHSKPLLMIRICEVIGEIRNRASVAVQASSSSQPSKKKK